MSGWDEDTARTIGDALAHGVAGDPDAGLALLQPFVDAGPLSTYRLLGALAEAAARPALQNQRPGEWFGMPVMNTVTGLPASADVLPPPVRFASQFLTAWANRDQDTAVALFDAFAFASDDAGTPDLAHGITALYLMAVATTTELVRAAREKRGGRG